MSNIASLIRTKMANRAARMSEISGTGVNSDEQRLEIVSDYDLTFASGKEFLEAADVDPGQVALLDKAIAMNNAEGEMISLRIDLERDLSA